MVPASLLFINARLAGPDGVTAGDLLVDRGRITRIGKDLQHCPAATVVDVAGRLLIPGLIDAHVHFREPGDPARGDLASESAAALAGGVTTVLDMPNTDPPTVDAATLADKRLRAARNCRCNHAGFVGATLGNLEEIRRLDPAAVPGVKLYLGSTTGDLLLDDDAALDRLFAVSPVPIAVHAEDDRCIQANTRRLRATVGDDPPAAIHAEVRDRVACTTAMRRVLDLTRRHGARLHLCHLSTADEVGLLVGVDRRRVSAEACLPHLWFTDADYARLGMRLKCNPAVKTGADRDALRRAVADGRIDLIATDHAPHQPSAKDIGYWYAAGGLPGIEFLLPALLDLVAQGALDLPALVARTSAGPAHIYGIADRGRLAEGCWADLVVADPAGTTVVDPATIRSRCGWSPYAGCHFRGRVDMVLVNGRSAWPPAPEVTVLPGMPLAFTGARR